MRILLINYEYPPIGGGGGNATFYIAREMAKRGFEPFVLTSHFKGLKNYEEKDGVKIIRTPVIRRKIHQSNPFEMATFIISGILKSISIKKLNPSLSIAFFSIPSGPIAYFLKKIFSISYVIYLRGGDTPGFLGKELSFYHRATFPIQKTIMKNASLIMAVSENLKKLALKYLGEFDIKIVPNGIDLDVFYPKDEIAEEPIKFLFVGRLTNQKGLLFLISALTQLTKNANKFQMIITGDGPLKVEIQRIIEECGLNNFIQLTGWIAKEKMPDLYRKCDVLVFPSIEEGTPNVLLEALASGLPCIATSIPGCLEFIKDGYNGFLVEPKNSEQLASAMKRTIENPELIYEMGKNARKSVESMDWGKRTEQIITFLAERKLIE